MEIIFNKLSYIENKDTNIEKRYLDDIDIVIPSGSIINICGDDMTIVGLLLTIIKRPTKGELKIDNVLVKKTSHIQNINNLRKKIGVVYTSNTEFMGKTVKEEIKMTMKNYDYRPSNMNKHLEDSLLLVGLSSEYLERNPRTLSSTEQAKVKLACALSYNPEVLYLENIDKGLTQREIDYIKKLLLKLKNKFHKTIIISSNRMEFSFELVDKVYVINKGKMVLSGGKEIFYDNKLYKYVEMPKIVEFTKYAQEMGHNILTYTDLKELIKELYRNVK